MIYLNPPFFLYEGMVVASDFSDPTQFWYYPNAPHLAKDDHGRPVIRFLVYKADLDEIAGGDDAVAGFLFFDTAVDWPEETLDKVASRLRNELNLDQKPRLAPLLYRSGKVRLVFLDRKSVQPGEQPGGGGGAGGGGGGGGAGGDGQPQEDWVTFIDAPAMPSLYGDNRAIFSVELTKKAAKLLYASFDGFIPAGVVYELNYVGMQRAFNVHVEADWSLAYKYIQERESHRILFWSSEMENIRQELEDKKIVKITGTLEGVGDEGMEGEFNEVRKQLNQFVFEKFFQPVPNPKELLDKGVGGGILDFLQGAHAIALNMNWGATRRQLDDNELRTLNVDYTVNRAVERMIAPQGHMSVFWEDFPGLKRSDVVTVVSGDDDLWRTVDVDVLAVADFAPDAVDKVIVDIAYGPMNGGEPSDTARRFGLALEKGKEREKVQGWYDPELGTAYNYQYKAEFGPKAVVGDGVELTSPWLVGHAPTPIAVNTGNLYEERLVSVARSRLLPADLFPEVLVHVRCKDEQSGWSRETSQLVTTEAATWQPAFRVPRGSPVTIEYRCDFNRPGGAIATDWAPIKDDLVVLNDPRPNLFPVRVLVAGDRSTFAQALVDLRYQDDEHNIFEIGSLRIDKAHIDDDHQWVFYRADPKRTRYSYSQVLIDTVGTVTTTGWVQTDVSTLLIGNVFAKRWEVRPEVVGPPLGDNGIERIIVDLSYVDTEHDYRSDKQVVFAETGPGEHWLLDLRDPSARSYTYTVRYRMRSGFDRKVGPLASSDTFLIVSSVPPQ